MAAPQQIPQPRRHRDHVILLASRLCALILLALLAGPAAGQAAQDDPRVVVHGPAGDRTLTERDVQDYDVLSRDYVLRAPGSEEHETLSGISVARVLQKAGYGDLGDGFVRLSRADGSWTSLSAADLRDGAFPDGPPLIFLDSARERYFRPVRDASDANARDNLATDAGQTLELFVESGKPLAVTVSASPDHAEEGQPVGLTASVAGDPPGVSVTWRFGDGEQDAGTSVEHRFAREGVYDVVAVARGAAGSGASDPIRVKVGTPPVTLGVGRPNR